MAKTPPPKAKTAIVSGASRGVGKGVALGLAETGATVYITGRTLEPGGRYPGSLRETAQQMEEVGAGCRAIPVVCDHADDDAVRALVEQVVREQGRIDLLVNNVYALADDLALWSQGRFWEEPLSMWDEQVNVGLRCHYVACYYAVPHMIEQGGALIVNISSCGAVEYHLNVAYGVVKAGLDKLSHDAAHQLRPYNVAVLSLWPGIVATERVVATMGEAASEMVMESPTFTGRAVAALLADKQVMELSGTHQQVHTLAQKYNFQDLSGTIPQAQNYL